jgi:hypothetical protein
MKEGDIIRIPLPQNDGKVKPRPVLLLKKLPHLEIGWYVE